MSENDLDYLSSSFDPSSLTVPRLRGILVEHGIQFPSSSKKPQLIELFNENVVPKAKKLLKAQKRIQRTSRGITDVESSQESTIAPEDEATLMPPPPIPKTPRTKSGGHKSKIGSEESEETPSGKKSAIKKTPRRSSSKHARASDTETTDADNPRPSARRSRKSEAVATPTVKIEAPDFIGRQSSDDAIFSEDNPFQSGSSPPADRSPSGEKKRKSISASSKDVTKRKSSSKRVSNGVKVEDGITVPSSKQFLPILKSEDDGFAPGEEFTPEETSDLAAQNALVPRRKKRQPTSRASKLAPWVVLLALAGGYGTWFRREKFSIGYCGLGRNPYLSLTPSGIEIPEWASILEPECEPCPPHAYCFPNLETTCEPDFVLRQHPLNLGGFLPIPPTCEPDGEKVRRVKAVADRAVEELRERRAKFECGELKDGDGKETPTVEIEEAELKTAVAQKRRRGMSEEEFESLWEGALGEIKSRDEVVVGEDGRPDHHPQPLLLSSTSLARLPLLCALRRSARLALVRHLKQLSLLTVLLSLLLYAYTTLLTARSTASRVPHLVTLALDRLALQAALHAHKPHLHPDPFISTGQLRDDVLRDEFVLARREGVWKRVSAIVERNANVRASVREGRSGEVGRVWEWIGAVGRLEDWDRERGSPAPALPAGVGTPEGEREGLRLRKWEEGGREAF
ncbi:MAG: inner nuclear membrane protein enriched at telomere/subtelomere region [Vezdaea acicularis]|nr:MAG: inner nuclear membrane protein enriched at telomere/subtelomere region [Vezdaea acicularis]